MRVEGRGAWQHRLAFWRFSQQGSVTGGVPIQNWRVPLTVQKCATRWLDSIGNTACSKSTPSNADICTSQPSILQLRSEADRRHDSSLQTSAQGTNPSCLSTGSPSRYHTPQVAHSFSDPLIMRRTPYPKCIAPPSPIPSLSISTLRALTYSYSSYN